MENKVKRIGYLPRKRVLEIIDEISKNESISRSKVVGLLVEEAFKTIPMSIWEITLNECLWNYTLILLFKFIHKSY